MIVQLDTQCVRSVRTELEDGAAPSSSATSPSFCSLSTELLSMVLRSSASLPTGVHCSSASGGIIRSQMENGASVGRTSTSSGRVLPPTKPRPRRPSICTTESTCAWDDVSHDDNDESLMERFRSLVEVKDRRCGVLKYKKCFVGCDAVDALISSGEAKSRAEAVTIGQHLAKKYGLFKHVRGAYTFQDRSLLYRFKKQQSENMCQMTSVSDDCQVHKNHKTFTRRCSLPGDIQVIWESENKETELTKTEAAQSFSDNMDEVRACCRRVSSPELLVSSGRSAEKYCRDCASRRYSFSSIDQDHISDMWIDIFNKVEVKTRVWRLKKYKQCFLGSEVVDLLIMKGLARSRADGVRVARIVNSQLGLFEHVANGRMRFQDAYEFYRFKRRIDM